MIRPFWLGDIGLVARLQQECRPLDLETYLTRSRSPLGAALLSLVMLHTGTVYTCIADQKEDNVHWQAMAQMRQRRGRPEYQITYIAPDLTRGNGAHAVWQRLLTYMCVEAGERGGQRLYVGLPPDSEEYQVFRHVGFTAFAREEVYERLSGPEDTDNAHLPLRRQRERDSWGLQQLYANLAPRSVQNADGSAQGDWELMRTGWGTSARRQGYVCEIAGEIKAAVQIRTNPGTYWLRILLHPDLVDQAGALITSALSRVNFRAGQRLYCAVRDYEAGVSSALNDNGFRPIGNQTLMVRHTTARLREPSLQSLSSLNGHVEHAASLKCHVGDGKCKPTSN